MRSIPFPEIFLECLKILSLSRFYTPKLKRASLLPNLTEAQQLQLDFFIEDFSAGKNPGNAAALIKDAKSVEALVQSIDSASV